MSFFKICRDPFVVAIRENYQATPLRTPDTSTLPLQVIAKRGKRIIHQGALKDLLVKGAEWNIEPAESQLADLAMMQTSKFDVNMGFKILGGFLKGLKIGDIPLQIGFKGAKELAFSFQNPKRIAVAPSTLGKHLIGQKLDLNNTALNIFTRNKKPFKMRIISSVICSNAFQVHFNKTDEVDVSAAIPVYHKYLASIDTDVAVCTGKNKSLLFEGAEFLTFAFSTIKAEIDPSDGTIILGETVRYRGLSSDADEPELQEVVLEEEEDVMVEWDME